MFYGVSVHDTLVKEGKTNAKLKGGLGAHTTKLMVVLMNTVTIIMQEGLRLTKCELAQILQIVPSTTHVLRPMHTGAICHAVAVSHGRLAVF